MGRKEKKEKSIKHSKSISHLNLTCLEDKKNKKHRKRSRSRSEEKKPSKICEFPPKNNVEFKSILLEYLGSSLFNYPIDSECLFEGFKSYYKKVEGSKELFKKLNILEVLKFFSEERSLVLEEQVLGFEMKHFIMDVN